jgi:2-succinyl-6-hydroxy-2,4-cyclohexadiene-1-carboxylate synthase
MKATLWTETRRRGPRVVLLHGFTQAGQSWNPVLREEPIDAEVFLPDLPGHGRSSSTALDLNATADALANSIGPAVYVGYSMGGRVALHLALRHPLVVRGLLLFGATAGLKTEVERAQRRQADELLAQDLEQSTVAAFLTRWLSNPLFATLPSDPSDLGLRERNTVSGLASSLRLCGTGSQASLWDELHTIRAPTIVVAGDRDKKFSTIGGAMADHIGPNAAFETIINSGHACHLEQPKQASALINTMLQRAALE